MPYLNYIYPLFRSNLLEILLYKFAEEEGNPRFIISYQSNPPSFSSTSLISSRFPENGISPNSKFNYVTLISCRIEIIVSDIVLISFLVGNISTIGQTQWERTDIPCSIPIER